MASQRDGRQIRGVGAGFVPHPFGHRLSFASAAFQCFFPPHYFASVASTSVTHVPAAYSTLSAYFVSEASLLILRCISTHSYSARSQSYIRFPGNGRHQKKSRCRQRRQGRKSRQRLPDPQHHLVPSLRPSTRTRERHNPNNSQSEAGNTRDTRMAEAQEEIDRLEREEQDECYGRG